MNFLLKVKYKMNYEETLIQLALNNKDIIVLTAENRASIRNLPNIIKNQFFDSGISEQSLIGISAGLSLRGRIPIVHGIAAFITMRAFEFIRTDIGYPNLNVKIVGSFPGFLSTANGPTHQAVEDVCLMRSIPNMNIFCPSDLDDLFIGLPKIVSYNKPFYIRYNDLPAIVEHSQFALGKAETFGDGNDIAILTYGTLFSEAFKAKLLLEEKGLSTRLVNLRTLKPIDEFEIIKSIKICKTIVTIEDHYKIGGIYSILSEIISREKLRADVIPLSLQNKFFKPALYDFVLEHEGFTAKQIADTIFNVLQTKQRNFNVEWSSI